MTVQGPAGWPYPTLPVWRMWLGAVLGMLLTPGMWAYPLGRLLRALYSTAWAESRLDPQAIGDGGVSVGILQFHASNYHLVSVTGWRRSAFWSGFAGVRYLGKLPMASLRLTLRTGLQGLNAWRAYWRTGRAGMPGDWLDSAQAPWGDGGWWLLTVVQYVFIVAVAVAAPWLAVAVVVTSVVWRAIYVHR